MPPAILVIEDDPTLARNIATFLSRSGYAVRCAGSAEEGLAALATFRPALVLQDIHLPGMSGLEMLAEMRRRDQDVKVIVMTADASQQVAREALAAGAHDFVVKPLSLAWLRTVLELSLR